VAGAPRRPADAAPDPAASAASPGSAALVRDARRLLAKGRLSEGRDMLKRAAAAGDSHAATILAKTYDPAVLKVWHVKGATVDPAEARRWYEKAQALGSPEAKAALEGMR
jgi:TPR repeat protein